MALPSRMHEDTKRTKSLSENFLSLSLGFARWGFSEQLLETLCPFVPLW
jgi:hypothetical protein